MSEQIGTANPCRPRYVCDSFFFVTLAFGTGISAIALVGGRGTIAVYALSYWHYGLYALAFFWRDVSLERFRFDAMLLKAMALAALAVACVSPIFAHPIAAVWPNPMALIAMIAGFGLNMIAARALGSDRTYYGFEIGGLAPLRITAFPYSWIPHPMLLGNMLAFGGLLLDAGFRQEWWPLALAHLLMNFLILVMELYGRQNRLLGQVAFYGALTLGTMALLAVNRDAWLLVAITAAACWIFGIGLHHRYTNTNHPRKLEG